MGRFISAALSALVGTILFAGSSLAAPLNYQESVSGDLTARAKTLFFDVGTNTVQGTSVFDNQRADFDSFTFVIPAGDTLGSISYSFHVINNTNLSFARTIFADLLNINDVTKWLDVDLLGASPVDSTGKFLTSVAQTVFASGLSNEFSITWDYTWMFIVNGPAAVPEPASLALLGTALVGLAAMLLSSAVATDGNHEDS